MDGIRKYSKEWFALQGGKEQANLAGLKKGVESRALQQSKTLNASMFVGTKEEIQEKYNKLVEADRGRRPSDVQTNIQKFGLENIIEALDANGDGEVTQEEVNEVAALDTGELASKDDVNLSTDDLKLLYNNALDAVNSSFEDNGLHKEFHFENGDVTKLDLDNRGQLSTKTKITHDSNGNEMSTTYGYKSKSVTEVKYDSDGREVNYKYDDPDNKKDYTRETTYADDGSKTVTKKEYIATTTSEYAADGNLKSEDIKYNYNSDGKIDATRQQSIGDCWVLSAVNALNESEDGKKILSDSIQHNDDGSVTVKLKGLNKEYTYSAEEIIDNKYQSPNKHYATGDTDMNLFEKAIGDYRQELIASGDYKPNGRDLSRTAGDEATVDDPLKGGQIDEAIYYITGLTPEYVGEANGKPDKVEKMLNTYNKDHDKYVMTVSFQEDDPNITGIIDHHAYNISNVDDENVYIVNPHDSSKVIAYPKADFLSNAKGVALTDLTSLQEKEQPISQHTISAPKEGDIYTEPKESLFNKISKFFQNLFR
ncbi:MAG: hypothetical protein K6C94_03555 [Candidatus Gastranaerophilales bacterium]|nr:hypothetical protein [Candidatus Gastranaerophilales bacterium]